MQWGVALASSTWDFTTCQNCCWFNWMCCFWWSRRRRIFCLSVFFPSLRCSPWRPVWVKQVQMAGDVLWADVNQADTWQFISPGFFHTAYICIWLLFSLSFPLSLTLLLSPCFLPFANVLQSPLHQPLRHKYIVPAQVNQGRNFTARHFAAGRRKCDSISSN